jgi:hypothetical protein
LGSWLGIADSNLRGVYIKELIDFGYISKVENNEMKWDSDNKVKVQKYKLEVDIHNSGTYNLVDNNIYELYNEIFALNK